MKTTKEQAKTALEVCDPQLTHEIKYYHAILDETLPQFYLETFQSYRHNYSDEIPEPDLSPEHPDYVAERLKLTDDRMRMKCRYWIIMNISFRLQSVIEDEVLTEQEHRDIVETYKMYEWNAGKGSKGEYWTSREEIDYINTTLDTVIDAIQQTHQL